MDLPINSELGLAIVAAYLLGKELVSAIKRKDKPDGLKDAITDLSKLLAIQTEILRNIADDQKEIFRAVREKPNCANYVAKSQTPYI